MIIVIVLALALVGWTWFTLVGAGPTDSAPPADSEGQAEEPGQQLWTEIDDLQLIRLLKDAAP